MLVVEARFREFKTFAQQAVRLRRDWAEPEAICGRARAGSVGTGKQSATRNLAAGVRLRLCWSPELLRSVAEYWNENSTSRQSGMSVPSRLRGE
jgi:hypothetical protein